MTFGQRFARVVTDVVVRRPELWRLFRRPLRSQFDKLAPRWDGLRRPDMLAPVEAALDRLTSRPVRVLDVGTGTGAVARLVAARLPEAEIEGVDVSERMIDEARRLSDSPRVRFQVADAEKLPFPDGSFDLVTLGNMIPFFGRARARHRAGRAGARRLLGRCRDADLRAAGAPAHWTGARGIQGNCGAFCRTWIGRRRHEELTSGHTERSRSGRTVLDVPSRGGAIRPILLAVCSCRDEAAAPARPAPGAVLHAAPRTRAGGRCARRRAARRPRPRQSGRAAAGARDRGADRERPRADSARPRLRALLRPARAAPVARPPVRDALRRRAGSRARGGGRPGNEVGARGADPLSRRTGRHRSAPRSVLPGLPVRNRARWRGARLADARPGARVRASLRRRAARTGGCRVPELPVEPDRRSRARRSLRRSGRVRARDRRDDHPRLRVRRPRLRRSRAAELPRRAAARERSASSSSRCRRATGWPAGGSASSPATRSSSSA